MTNMQARLQCASKPSGLLDGQDANMTFKLFHHLTEFFNQLPTSALICIKGWIPIKDPEGFCHVMIKCTVIF
jgi:hypothetical protein